MGDPTAPPTDYRAPEPEQLQKLLASIEAPTAKDRIPQDDLDREKDRSLREKFMNWMIGIMIGQLFFVNGTILGLAIPGIIEIEEWTLRLWITGTLIEVFAIVLVIAKYLFPARNGSGSQPGTKSA